MSSGYGGDRSAARVLSPEAYCFILDLDSDDQDRLEFQLSAGSICRYEIGSL